MVFKPIDDMMFLALCTISFECAAKTADVSNFCIPNAFTNRHIFCGVASYNSRCGGAHVYVIHFGKREASALALSTNRCVIWFLV